MTTRNMQRRVAKLEEGAGARTAGRPSWAVVVKCALGKPLTDQERADFEAAKAALSHWINRSAETPQGMAGLRLSEPPEG